MHYLLFINNAVRYVRPAQIKPDKRNMNIIGQKSIKNRDGDQSKNELQFLASVLENRLTYPMHFVYATSIILGSSNQSLKIE